MLPDAGMFVLKGMLDLRRRQRIERLEGAQGMNASFGGFTFLGQSGERWHSVLVPPFEQQPLRSHARPDVGTIEFSHELFRAHAPQSPFLTPDLCPLIRH